MPVDKFGLMMSDAGDTTIISPLNRFAQNLDDLENVEGFNEDGHKEKIYGFKLDENGIYNRIEIDSTVDPSGLIEYDPNDDITSPFILVLRNGKWKAIPFKQDWEIDIKLVNDKISTKGDNHAILKLFNSGIMMTSLVPNKSDKVLVRNKGLDLYLNTPEDEATLTFKFEFNDQRVKLWNNISDSTFCIIIEGYIHDVDNSLLPIVNGLKIKWTVAKKEFRIIIESNKEITKISTMPPELQSNALHTPEEINLRNIFLHKNYDISRIRFTRDKVSKYDIFFH